MENQTQQTFKSQPAIQIPKLESVRNIYVEIDSLVDTRLTLALSLDEEHVREDLRTKKYYNRLNDNFGYVAYNLFRSIYKLRNKALLQDSLPTPLIHTIRECFAEAFYDIVKNEENNDDIIIYLNLYPYHELTTHEVINIKKTIETTIEGAIVRTIYLSNSDLLPSWVSSNVGYMFKYDALTWLEQHVATLGFLSSPLVKVCCFAPMVCVNNAIQANIDIKFFEKLENDMKSLMLIQFLPVRYFSAIDLDELKELRELREQQANKTKSTTK